MIGEQRIRIEPVFDRVTGIFDKWVTDLKAAGQDLNLTTNEVSLIVRSDSKANLGSAPVRSVSAEKGGGSMILKIEQAIVSDGSYLQQFRMEIRLNLPGGGRDIWALTISDNYYQLAKYRPEFRYAEYRGEQKYPIGDAPLLDAIKQSFDEVMAYGLNQIESAQETNQ
jgi:hypothetical protein